MGDNERVPTREQHANLGEPALGVDENLVLRSLSPAGTLLFDIPDADIVGTPLATLEEDGLLRAGTVDSLRALLSGADEELPGIVHTAIQRGDETDPVPYDLVVERGTDDEIRLSVAERETPDRDSTLSALRAASGRLQTAETAPELMRVLGESLADVLRPTGVDVRLHEPARSDLWRVTHAERTQVVDRRESVDASADPYAGVVDDGERAQLSGERLDALRDDVEAATGDRSLAGYTAVIVVPVGDHGTVTIGRVGTEITDAEVDATELLCEYAATAIREQQYSATIAEQRTALDRYETLVESIPDPVYLTDETGEISVVNRAFERTFGYSPSDHGEVHITEFTTTDSATALRETIRDLVDTDEDRYTELSVTGILPDGRQRQFQATVGCVAHDGTFDSAVGVLRDVTDRHRQQEISKVMNRAFRHNLRTATNNIKGYAEVTQSRISGETDEYMDIIQEECDWLVKLGDTMREIRESISEQETETNIPVAELVEPVVQWNENEFPGATITVHYNTEGYIEGGTTLQTALDNIVENAILHTESDTPTVEIWVANAPEENWIDIHVEDNGPGIPEQERQLIMGETEITQLQHGSGLGLWVARWLVQTFDGELLIESNPDGSVVTLRVRKVT